MARRVRWTLKMFTASAGSDRKGVGFFFLLEREKHLLYVRAPLKK